MMPNPTPGFAPRRAALRRLAALGAAWLAPPALRVQGVGAASADPGPADTPTYRTRMPPAARTAYEIRRSGLVGSGEIDWRPEGDRYTLKLEGRLPLVGTLIVQTSRGGFDAAGLAPERYTDQRLRRAERAAEFRRATGRVAFSDGQPEVALRPGTQDRLSVMLQLAAIANAWERPPSVGETLRMPVVGARGDAKVWALRYEGRQSLQTPGGGVDALRFQRVAEEAGDTRVEFWLDPAAAYLPMRARFTDGDGDTLELRRVEKRS